MSPAAHFIGSWLVGVAMADNPRDRRLITLAGMLPDVDGLGMVADVARAAISGQELNFEYYHRFHHLWCHGWPAALVFTGVLVGFARKRWRVAAGCLIAFHLHLLCDLLGSRGPSTADLWPICYSEPLFRHPIWFLKSQWRLDGWQNAVIFLGLLGLALWVTISRGVSFAEMFGSRVDRIFVGVVRKWWEFAARALQGLREN